MHDNPNSGYAARPSGHIDIAHNLKLPALLPGTLRLRARGTTPPVPFLAGGAFRHLPLSHMVGIDAAKKRSTTEEIASLE